MPTVPNNCRNPVLISLMLLLAAGCVDRGRSTCESCHQGIEKASAGHSSCISCHGGDDRTEDKERSHRGMYGRNNPSAPGSWEKSCGTCHRYQLERVQSNLMLTNTGMIKNIQLTWEGKDPRLFATGPTRTFDAAGKSLQLAPVTELDNLSGELYRKFCSQCHVGSETKNVFAAGHAAGCAACHFPYNDQGSYEGNDRTVRGKRPAAASHALSPLPANDVCFRCHNRSGRIALSYQGLYDGNNSLVPTRGGRPGPVMISGGRNVVRIAPDVHHAAGMECID